MTSSFCKEPLLAPGAEPSEGGKSGSLACGRPPRREHRPRQGAAPSLPAAGGGRLKGAAWRRLKAKQLLIYNVAEREMVAKKDKDAGIAGILQPPRLRRVKPLECVCVAGGGSALSPSGCPPHPPRASRGAAEAGGMEVGMPQGALAPTQLCQDWGCGVQVCPAAKPPRLLLEPNWSCCHPAWVRAGSEVFPGQGWGPKRLRVWAQGLARAF